MRSGTFAFTLLSLFTSEQRAAEIEGDLIEERAYRGRAWFVIHLIGTVLALFMHSYRQAPFRITALGVAATCLSVATCRLLDSVFFAPDAILRAPLLGLLAIPASAFLTGFGLGYFGSGLGIRAATLTTILLTLLFIVAQTSPSAFLAMLVYFAGSIVIFLAPLMAGSVYGHRAA